MSLRHKTATGILWNFAQLLSQRLVTILVTLLLARFLVPEAFGLMAMMAVFVAVAGALMNSGFKEALIRKESVSQLDLSTAFYSNLSLGLLAYGLLFLTAPLVADFYREPRLVNLIRVAGLSVVIGSLQVVQVSVLNRALNFRAQIKAAVPSTVISGVVAIGLAHLGFGVWALVAQTVLATLLNTVLLFLIQHWTPSLAFSRASMISLFSFGYKLFLAGLLDLVFQNIYVAVIAKFFSAALAGQYFFADKIRQLVLSQLVTSIQTVTYPALAQLQGNDMQLSSAYRKILAMTTFILFPAMLFLAALAEPLFQSFLPDQWLPASYYLQLMCLASTLYPLHSINLNILKVKGRSDLFFSLEVFKKLIVALVLMATIPFGIKGILIGQIVTSIFSYLPNSFYSARLINYSLFDQVKDVAPALTLSSLIAAITYTAVKLTDFHPAVELLGFGFGAVALYVAVCYSLKLRACMFALALVKEKTAVRRTSVATN